MKSLLINPQDYDIQCNSGAVEDGVVKVCVRLGLHNPFTSAVLNETEARRIGGWFLKLAKEVRQSRKTGASKVSRETSK